jgi:16S rRNA uridine-516 pseudouridylate synthase and related pseudouridylate synthases
MSRSEETSPGIDGVRLQKVLARAGVASRRAAEQMISQGRVSVDGAVVREQGLRVHPEQAVIHVDGMRLELRSDVVHLAMNKPRGVHCTMSDDRGRQCVGDYVADRPSGCSTSAGSTQRPKGCCCSPTTGSCPPADAPVL